MHIILLVAKSDIIEVMKGGFWKLANSTEKVIFLGLIGTELFLLFLIIIRIFGAQPIAVSNFTIILILLVSALSGASFKLISNVLKRSPDLENNPELQKNIQAFDQASTQIQGGIKSVVKFGIGLSIFMIALVIVFIVGMLLLFGRMGKDESELDRVPTRAAVESKIVTPLPTTTQATPVLMHQTINSNEIELSELNVEAVTKYRYGTSLGFNGRAINKTNKEFVGPLYVKLNLYDASNNLKSTFEEKLELGGNSMYPGAEIDFNIVTNEEGDFMNYDFYVVKRIGN